MTHNTSTDGEVIVGASLSDSFEMDDTLPWESSKPKVIIVVQRGNCLADLLAAFIDPDIMNKDVLSKENFPTGSWKMGKALVFSVTASQNSGENFTESAH